MNRKYHDLSNTPEYWCWRRIKQKCYDPYASNFKYYGGRGIKMDESWYNSFEAFFKYVGKRPTPKHTLERINNNKNYEPGNVRWATKREQCNNRRTNKSIEYKGESRTVAEWARVLGLKRQTLHSRLVRNGWNMAALFD